MAGPTSDYGYTSFGSDVTTPGYVSESATGAQCNTAGTCTYTFQHAIPADAKGSFAIGIESRRTETLLAGHDDRNGRAVRSDEQGVLFLSRWIACSAAANALFKPLPAISAIFLLSLPRRKPQPGGDVRSLPQSFSDRGCQTIRINPARVSTSTY